MRAALRRIDDGEYPFEDFLDDGARIKVNVTIRGDEAERIGLILKSVPLAGGLYHTYFHWSKNLNGDCAKKTP